MRTLIHLVGVLLVAGSLWLALSMSAVAGYGNHAERATVNIQTRVEIGKLSLQNQVSQFKVVAARGGVPQP